MKKSMNIFRESNKTLVNFCSCNMLATKMIYKNFGIRVNKCSLMLIFAGKSNIKLANNIIFWLDQSVLSVI